MPSKEGECPRQRGQSPEAQNKRERWVWGNQRAPSEARAWAASRAMVEQFWERGGGMEEVIRKQR